MRNKIRFYNFIKWLLPFIYLLIFSSQLNNKISSNNHNLLITLTTVENWDIDGIENHKFNIIHSWGNAGDLNIHYYKRVMSKEGRNYFVSYPPLSFILVYPFLKCFPNYLYPFGFKIFGVLIHIITYLMLFCLFRKKSKFQQILGAASFLFFPASVVLSGMYYPEQLILLLIVFFAIGLKNNWNKIWLGVLSFLMVYTDWLGYLIIVGFITEFIVNKQKRCMYPILIGALFGSVLLFFQYSSIAGIDGLIQGLKVRYLERAGIFPEKYSDRGVNLISGEALIYLKAHLVPAVLFSLIIMLVLKVKIRAVTTELYIIIFPILIHLIVLFNSNILHFQNLSKLGIVVAILLSTVTIKTNLKYLAIFLPFYSFFVCWWYWSGYPVNEQVYVNARIIKTKNKSDSVMIIHQESFSESLVILSYLSKRNLIWANSRGQINKILTSSNQSKYVLLKLSD